MKEISLWQRPITFLSSQTAVSLFSCSRDRRNWIALSSIDMNTYNVCSTVTTAERGALVDGCSILATVAFTLLSRCGGCWLRSRCVLSWLLAEQIARLPGGLVAVWPSLTTLVIACTLIRPDCATSCVICSTIGSGRGSTTSSLDVDDTDAATSSLAMACLPISFFHLFCKCDYFFNLFVSLS